MSELFYNRDQNISGITVPDELAFTPDHGSRVSFRLRGSSYPTSDGHMNTIPYSANSLVAEFDLKFSLPPASGQSLVAFIEGRTTGEAVVNTEAGEYTHSGFSLLPFAWNDASAIYKEQSGYCDSYAVSMEDNQMHEVAMRFGVDTNPLFMSWSGGAFVNTAFVNYESPWTYSYGDIVYYAANDNKMNNFFYFTGEDPVTLGGGESETPTGSVGSLYCTQEFPLTAQIGQQHEVSSQVVTNEFRNSIASRSKMGQHTNSLRGLKLEFRELTDTETKMALHFLEKKGGNRRFRWQPPEPYNRPKVFHAPSWSHTWRYQDVNDLTVEFMEDPLGILPTAG